MLIPPKVVTQIFSHRTDRKIQEALRVQESASGSFRFDPGQAKRKSRPLECVLATLVVLCFVSCLLIHIYIYIYVCVCVFIYLSGCFYLSTEFCWC